MSKPKLILIGAGGHAHACIDVIEQHGGYQIAGLVGMPEEMHTQHLGYEVIATDGDLPQLVKDYPYALITVGQIQTPDHRIRLHQQANKLGFQLPAIIAPSAHVSHHATVGSGSIVMHGAIINAGARVGSNCIINTRALLEHDVAVADHCHISTGAILNGDVKIGAGSFVGSGSVIKESLTLGQRCVMGMGLSVRHNQAAHAHFLGHNKS
ncbi:NeuD/PglB/VioB family sugar acetyltransferase [Rhodoferax ferrireducens]|uniref:NeuD/PglB/VioB family sugar acetyltransferase n=1 Tax=Rhodoferax ferrireducens TaxID=192843 RepID=UPI00298E2A01|nr:NeuD/PglB/VioB family sugar acetyltransferase [Rhodoferax ferrireducens]WPC68109.1 NeuD/PglB/VioB family sugar acetyltransferase [Rhodoferax ferrireducens]